MVADVFPFLLLPRELRDHVYHYLLREKHETRTDHYHDKRIRTSTIIRINRQIRDEFLDLFFEQATAQSEACSANWAPVISIPVPASFMPRIKSIRLKIKEDYPSSKAFRSWNEIIASVDEDLALFPELQSAHVSILVSSLDKSGATRLPEDRYWWRGCPLFERRAVQIVHIELNERGLWRTSHTYAREEDDATGAPQYKEVVFHEEIDWVCGTADFNTPPQSDSDDEMHSSRRDGDFAAGSAHSDDSDRDMGF